MSLRETIEEAVNTVETSSDPVKLPVTTEAAPITTEAAPVEETAEQKAGRTAGRPRVEHGSLLPGKPQKTDPVQSAHVEAAPVESAKPKVPPPSSWKKDHWGSWEKIATENPQLADYLNQREGEFAKGVSTYKQEYESVKPLADAIQPLLPTLQQHGIQPAQWITNMGQAHHSLVFGTPQQKLQMFTKLAQDYQVPLQALYDPQAQQQFLMQQTLQPQVQQQPNMEEFFEKKWIEKSAVSDLEQFTSAKDGSGNPLYPHYERVRDDMALFLESGKAQDLKSAYEKAIRLHDDIWQAEQDAKHAASQKAAQEAQQRQVNKAKATAVSPRTATPGVVTAKTPTGIRAAVESAVEAHSSEGGRV